jgi:hypothetical protein
MEMGDKLSDMEDLLSRGYGAGLRWNPITSKPVAIIIPPAQRGAVLVEVDHGVVTKADDLDQPPMLQLEIEGLDDIKTFRDRVTGMAESYGLPIFKELSYCAKGVYDKAVEMADREHRSLY